jgi:two-component system cell cycle sensor histidine kinase/response regulator CckA
VLNRPTVLLVDDDDDVRQILAIALANAFDLLVAASGVEAVKIMADRQIDLLLTDVMMPGMNGFDLADKAMLMRPELRIVYMTGYSDQLHSTRRRHGKIIPKPFKPAQMVIEIASALMS